MFQSRRAIDVPKYILSSLTREDIYLEVASRYPPVGYDAARWLNTNIKPDQRVAVQAFRYKYLLDTDILMNSETREELQWLYENKSTSERFCYINE